MSAAHADPWFIQTRGDKRCLTLCDGSEWIYWSGEAWQLGSAAFWEDVATGATEPISYRIGNSIREEIAACLLGGFGMPFEVGLAAFHALKVSGLLEEDLAISAAAVEDVLRLPLEVSGRRVRYRFPHQRSTRLSAALALFDERADEICDLQPQALRDWLTNLPGIGMKTASWIVRNSTIGDEIAILDVHLLRAGRFAGVFDPKWEVQRDYRLIESAFVGWSRQAALSSSLWTLRSGAKWRAAAVRIAPR